jgi:hypothetical protein
MFGTQMNADFLDSSYPTTQPDNRTQIDADKKDSLFNVYKETGRR